VRLDSNQSGGVRPTVTQRDLSYFDTDAKAFVAKAGQYELLIVRNAEEIHRVYQSASPPTTPSPSRSNDKEITSTEKIPVVLIGAGRCTIGLVCLEISRQSNSTRATDGRLDEMRTHHPIKAYRYALLFLNYGSILKV
jgi:hypothetical protein